ncbi:MAG: T9SS C-terminal target domain-containing protein, partial [Bacteroidales bacterium]
MKNFTRVSAVLLMASAGISASAQDCTYKTPNSGWTPSEWYKVIHIDAAKLTDAALPKSSVSDGKFNAVELDYGTGSFETPILDGLNNLEIGKGFPVNFYMCTFAPTHYGSAYTKVEEYGEEPSGKNHPCSKNDNTVLPVSTYSKQGFIELSRLPGNAEAQISKHGYLQIDNLYQVDRIQWSFSSTSWGRGVKMEIKWPGEEEWTEQRWVP